MDFYPIVNIYFMRTAETLLRHSWHMHYYKYLCDGWWQLEEAKLLRAQGQDEIAISLAKYIIQNYVLNQEVQMYIAWLGSCWQKLELASCTLNIYIQKICCVPLGFICASFFNFLNCLAHCACGLKCSSRTILEKYL